MKAETAKSKASHLFGKMYKYQLDKRNPVAWQLAIKCSCVAVNEVIETVSNLYIIPDLSDGNIVEYWIDVKKELEGMK
jgi:hypothetical protein